MHLRGVLVGGGRHRTSCAVFVRSTFLAHPAALPHLMAAMIVPAPPEGERVKIARAALAETEER